MDKVKVVINNNQNEIKIPKGLRMIVRRSCIAVLRMEEVKESTEVSVTFVDNEQIQKLNKEYRGKDEPTDVLSFPMNEGPFCGKNSELGYNLLGDIVISMEMAQKQADKYSNPLQKEVGHLTTHSMLHLLGYDHEKDEVERIRMREKETIIMSQLGFTGLSSDFYLK